LPELCLECGGCWQGWWREWEIDGGFEGGIAEDGVVWLEDSGLELVVKSSGLDELKFKLEFSLNFKLLTRSFP
jgi:hypothetical protein